MVYTRTLGTDRMVVVANFSQHQVTLTIPDELNMSGECLISNYKPVESLNETIGLEPYEAFAILAKASG
jgi:oligo-1,6-glucosidase